MRELIQKCYLTPNDLSDDDVLQLLSIDCHSDDFYHLMMVSNRFSRQQFANRGYVFMQIGLNAEPCSGDCKFCSLGSNHFAVEERWHKTQSQIIDNIKAVVDGAVDDIFLMTTADFSLDEFITIAKSVKQHLNSDTRLAANIGDFTISDATRLREAGITGVYHVNRLREGVDTAIKSDVRVETLEAIKAANLELYYCIEPIGAEHSYEEILVEIRRAQHLQPEVMAVMRRVAVANTPISDRENITALELTKIAAVTNLMVRPSRAMNLHESEQMSLLAGTNQLYAECGANPRDNSSNTELSRGLSINRANELLRDSGWLRY